jgi:hypothetical protein
MTSLCGTAGMCGSVILAAAQGVLRGKCIKKRHLHRRKPYVIPHFHCKMRQYLNSMQEEEMLSPPPKSPPACVTTMLLGRLISTAFLKMVTSFWITLYRDKFYFFDRFNSSALHGYRCTTGCGAHTNFAGESACLTADNIRNEAVTTHRSQEALEMLSLYMQIIFRN